VARVAAGGVLALAVLFLWLRFAPSLYSSFDDPFPDAVTATLPDTASETLPDEVTETQAAAIESLKARLESDTWMWRLNIAREVLRVVKESPLIGFGTLTFGQTHDVLGRPSPTPSDGWIPTGSLLVLHDTGVVGLVLFGIFLLAIAFDTVRAMRPSDVEGRSLALGGLAGLVAWLGMEQMSTNMILGIGWGYLGLISAVAATVRTTPPRGTAVAQVDQPESRPTCG
jgi:O-antigen ligase